MTTNKELLELAEKFGAKVVYEGAQTSVLFESHLDFLAYTSAIEEKYQAQIAMLRSAIANGEDVVINNYSNRAIPLEVAFTVLTNTQATADAFIAEVKAGAKLNKWQPIAKVIRNSAGQISIQNPDGSSFDVSKHIGETFFALPPAHKE